MATLFLLLWSIASAFRYLEQFLGARKIPAEKTPIVQFSPEKFPPRNSSTLDSSSHKLGKEASGENFWAGILGRENSSWEIPLVIVLQEGMVWREFSGWEFSGKEFSGTPISGFPLELQIAHVNCILRSK